MTDNPEVCHRRFYVRPGWVILALLALDGFLMLSERFGWFTLGQKKGAAALVAVECLAAATLLLLLWFIAALVLHLRFQFSIRSLLLMTAVVAVNCSWLAVEKQETQQQQAPWRGSSN